MVFEPLDEGNSALATAGSGAKKVVGVQGMGLWSLPFMPEVAMRLRALADRRA
jgi:hypothetical protein